MFNFIRRIKDIEKKSQHLEEGQEALSQVAQQIDESNTQIFRSVEKLNASILDLKNSIENSGKTIEPDMASLLRTTVGLPPLKFHEEIDDEGSPPHYLANLEPSKRTAKVNKYEALYHNTELNELLDYMQNLFGNTAIRSTDKDNVRNGAIAIVAIDYIKRELLDRHNEYLDATTRDEPFDKFSLSDE